MGIIEGGRARVGFVSAEQTGNGSAQNIAHGLGETPRTVAAFVTGWSGAAPSGATITAGTHDATNVVFTVTTNIKYIAVAWP